MGTSNILDASDTSTCPSQYVKNRDSFNTKLRQLPNELRTIPIEKKLIIFISLAPVTLDCEYRIFICFQIYLKHSRRLCPRSE